MRISHKIILIFSLMMIAALVVMSTYSASALLDAYNSFTGSRLQSLSDSISGAIERELSMMELTIQELTDNASFMAMLNQFVRDDSADLKMANAARSAVQQQLYRSPLVDYFYRVTFYTRDGRFVTSRVEKDDYLESGTPQARSVLSALPWLDAVDSESSRHLVLGPHNDFLSVRRDITVYGIVHAVLFHGKPIGYFEVSNEIGQLNDIMARADGDAVEAQVSFDNGPLLYTSMDAPAAYPPNMPQGELIPWRDESGTLDQQVIHTRVEWLGMNVYLARSQQAARDLAHDISVTHLRTVILIMVPTILLILFVSFLLTKSINRLTRKVSQLSVDGVLQHDESTIRMLTGMVTLPRDRETHELERVFNAMVLRLRESAMNEMALREGALQAQLSALQMQINPHFIYNTLNIISAKGMESDNMEIIEICDQFAQMLRYSTDTRSRTATLAEEIDNVRNYLCLAKARYEDSLEYAIDVPPELEGLEIPKLTLQPIVENALKHGYNGQSTPRVLTISSRVENGMLLLEIRDNGAGFPPDRLAMLQTKIARIEAGDASLAESGGHIGLVNTCLRLHYYSNGAMHISVRNDHGAVVLLTMPCRTPQ